MAVGNAGDLVHPIEATRAGPRGGIAFIVGSALAFGAMAIMARFAFASGVDTPTLLALRFTIAGACMALLLVLRRQPLPAKSDVAKLVALGAAGYAGQAFTFFTALTLAPASLTALLLYLHPAIVAVLAALFLHERMSRVKLGALALALVGMLATVAPALRGTDASPYPNLPTGIACALAAAAIYAIYIVSATRIAARVAALPMATVVVASAGAVFAIVASWHGPRFPQSAAGWLAVGGIAVVSTLAAITLYFAGLARIGPTRAATLSTIEPVFTVFLAALLLGERIETLQFFGGTMILAAVLLLANAASPASSEGSPS